MDFPTFITSHEPLIRLSLFVAVFLVLALWEWRRPWRVASPARRERWGANLLLAVLNSLIVRIFFPGAAVAIAVAVEQQGVGLLPMLSLPAWLAVALAVVLLDLAIYFQHVLFHAVPALWRVHRMHHADQVVDVTTGLRFHPIEMLLSMGIKAMVILALGAPPLAVFLFELLLNLSSVFNHAHAALPARVEAWVRRFVVTPSMHRVHHSLQRDETNSNFGFNLPWWDYLFGTYRAAFRAPAADFQYGIPEIRDARRCHGLIGMLSIPFIANRPVRSSATPLSRGS